MALLGPVSGEAVQELTIALASRQRTQRQAFAMANEAARGGALSPRLCAALARACGASGAAEEAKLLRRRMVAQGLPLAVSVRADLVRAFGQAAQEGDAERLLAHAWREVVEAKAAGQMAPELLHAMRLRRGTWVAGAVRLSAYCAAGAPGHAEQILADAGELGVEADETRGQGRWSVGWVRWWIEWRKVTTSAARRPSVIGPRPEKLGFSHPLVSGRPMRSS